MISPDKIKLLKRISPSQYTYFKECPYKLVLANYFHAPLLPIPPSSHFGSVLHKCIEKILKGEIISEEEFNNQWDNLITQEEKKIRKMGFDFYLPLKQHVSGYTIKKIQLKRLLKKNYKNYKTKDSESKISSEKWLASKDGLICGFIDLIVANNNFTKISDFKTGNVHDENGEVKENYVDQLKLYAYIFHENYGYYPNLLSIIQLNGTEIQIPFTVQECEQLANLAKDKLNELNTLIKNQNYRGIANPKIDNCHNCLYKPACSYYWSIVTNNNDTIFQDLRGNLESIREFENGNLNITILHNSEKITIAQISKRNFQFLNNYIGKQIAVFNVLNTKYDNFYKAVTNTIVYEC